MIGRSGPPTATAPPTAAIDRGGAGSALAAAATSTVVSGGGQRAEPSQSDAPVVATEVDLISARTAQRLADSVAATTRRAYARTWDGQPHPDSPPLADPARGGFVGWCAQASRSPLPATARTLAEYVAHLADRDLASSTIAQAIAAIRTRHRLARHASGRPDTELALRVLTGHRRDRAGRGLGARAAPSRPSSTASAR